MTDYSFNFAIGASVIITPPTEQDSPLSGTVIQVMKDVDGNKYHVMVESTGTSYTVAESGLQAA